MSKDIFWFKLKNRLTIILNKGIESDHVNNIVVEKDDIIKYSYNKSKSILFLENCKKCQYICAGHYTMMDISFLEVNSHIFEDITKSVKRDNKIKYLLDQDIKSE